MRSLTDSLKKTYNSGNSKKILSSTEAFGLLRKELIENMGVKRIRGFLFRYGWRLGSSDAEEAKKISTSIDYLIKQASLLHLSTGHIRDIQSERQIEKKDAKNIKSITAKGKWIDSFEGLEHIRHHGISDAPVCHTLTGYASGYMSSVCNANIIVKETSCIGKGDKECIFEMKYEDDWGDEIQEELGYYHEKKIVEELEYTYEQLLEERNYIEKVSKFHKTLTESISNGSNLPDITTIVYESLKIPVIFEDLSFEDIAFSGLSEAEYALLNKDLKENSVEKNRVDNILPIFKKTKIMRTSNQTRLITPLYVQKKIIGYCSFVYIENTADEHSKDFMFIERVANAASLILLNEKTSFDALEKLKGNFLEQILTDEITSKEDIVNRGRYMGLDFDDAYYIAAIEYKEKGLENQTESHSVGLIETISKHLDIQGSKALVGRYENHIAMLIPEKSVDKQKVIQMIQKLYHHLEATYKSIEYKIGLSNQATNIAEASQYLEKALIALRVSNKRKITDYEELGILGVLINSKNTTVITEIAEKELGPLVQTNDPKNLELIKTLYVFLSNGGNLHQTMDDLSLSMSGLTYRKNKIEKLINKDLRDPSQSYQLLLILDSLIALEELEL
ncbi:XylR N-terminal domain-containing protein [Aquibacillus saliphilus]|uniref:XylR N-terminal domain-containing protein n=1 Tax=Aquibacillus saliphilus TaxID=1909422 RepID=UPI001CEFB4BD|nr:XylR N-terminal domain-containing protein [Aquibacillus saliphilus]